VVARNTQNQERRRQQIQIFSTFTSPPIQQRNGKVTMVVEVEIEVEEAAETGTATSDA